MDNVIQHLGRLPKKALIALSLVLVSIVGAADYLAGPDVGVSFFYLIPVSLATWFAGRSAGIVLSLFSAAIWFSAKWITEEELLHPLAISWNAAIRLGFFLVVVFMQHALQKEQAAARRDPLTGGNNRRFFLEVAEMEIVRARRYRHPLSVAYMDLDDFKAVNDQYGHDAGDELLRRVMKVLQDNVRTSDTVARLGGDEFAFILPETDGEAAGVVMKKIHRQLSMVSERNRWPVKFSMGVAAFAEPPETLAEMLKTVDRLMYEAKNGGKNQVKLEVFGRKRP